MIVLIGIEIPFVFSNILFILRFSRITSLLQYNIRVEHRGIRWNFGDVIIEYIVAHMLVYVTEHVTRPIYSSTGIFHVLRHKLKKNTGDRVARV